MPQIRVTSETIIHSIGLYLGVPALVLSAIFLFREITKDKPEPPAQSPMETVSETNDEPGEVPADAEKSNPKSQDASKSWEEPSSRKAGERQTLTVNGVEYAFRWIPPGSFIMGSPKSEKGRREDEAQHNVNIAYGFWMLETEVTREMWKSIIGYVIGKEMTSPRFPVSHATWDYCQEYIEELNEREECPQGFEFRLPTEEEWEYACRAGTTTAFSFGDTVEGDCMNCDGRRPYSSPALVGKYQPNPWGLYDMHGNVEEWTASTKFLDYKGSSLEYTEEEQGTFLYVTRGGGWESSVDYCRSAARNATPTTYLGEDIGVRIVLSKIGCINEAPSEDVATPPQDASSDSVAVESKPDSQPEQETSTTNDAPEKNAEPDVNAEKSDTKPQDASKSWEEFCYEYAKSLKEPTQNASKSWEEPSSRKAGERRTMTIDGVEYAFRWIPPGSFTMGSPKSEKGREKDEEQHEVNINCGFWMLETEVTQEMWKSIHGYDIGKSPRLPVVYVTWDGCREYVEKLNEREECPEGCEFRLPTEEEWEYACRAGTKTMFSFGNSVKGDCMNCDGRPPLHSPALVGKYPPNPWGLYDMHGNVEEWTASSRFVEFEDDLKFTEEEPGMLSYIIRGGGWKSSVDYCRSAARNGAGAHYLGEDLGLRIVLSKIGRVNEASDEDVATPPQDDASDGDVEESSPDSPIVQKTSTKDDAEKKNGESGVDAEKSNPKSQDASKSWEEPSSRKAGERRTTTIDGVEYAFRWIPPGTFMMGDLAPAKEEQKGKPKKELEEEPEEELEAPPKKKRREIPKENPEEFLKLERDELEEPREVTIDRGFWMLETEVTQEMWKSIEGFVVSDFKGTPRFPVENVDWNECQDYVKKLSGRKECPEGFEFRLPTEEEWEYACRAGTTTAFSFGDSVKDHDMNCSGRPPYTSPALVGKYRPNPWGLYDMHGNVEEWTVSSKFHEFEYGLQYTEEESGMLLYIIRGGGWKSAAKHCRSAYRNAAGAEFFSENLGFRIVLDKIDSSK